MRIQLTARRLLLVLLVMALMINGKDDETYDCRDSPGEFKQNTSFKASVGENIILPCIPKFKISTVNDFFEWYKGKVQITLIKENNVNYIDDKYKGRISETALIGELSKGTASLNLSNVNLSDNGSYCCRIHRENLLTCVYLTLVVEEKKVGKQTNDQKSENTTDPAACPDWLKPVCAVLVSVFAVSTFICAGIAIWMWKKYTEEKNKNEERLKSQNSEEASETIPMKEATVNDLHANTTNSRQRSWWWKK